MPPGGCGLSSGILGLIGGIGAVMPQSNRLILSGTDNEGHYFNYVLFYDNDVKPYMKRA